MVERKRGRKAMYMDGRMNLYSGNQFSIKLQTDKEKQVVTLFGNVKKSFNNFIAKNGLVVNPIEPLYHSYYRNTEMYQSLPNGTEFDIIDVNHCFWRISYLLGYISERVYKNTLKKPDMKLFRNMALSCTIAPKIREYYISGKKIMEITEDTSLYQTMYKNIRYGSYNAVGSICEAIGNGNCLGYRTDGIFTLPQYSKEIKRLMRKSRLNCKTVKCVKVDDRFYLQKDENKQMKF
jgi:hypothetical protein